MNETTQVSAAPVFREGSTIGAMNISGGNNGNGYKEIRSKYKVLLAEDNLINQKVSLKILSSAGYEAEAVNNGAEAVEAVAKGSYDIVLMDIQMPEVDGYTATKRIREMNQFTPGEKEIPIIALTAHALMGDKEKCIQAGMNEYISKPIIAKDLISMIDNLLEINSNSKRLSETISNKLNDENSVFDYERLKKVSNNDFEFEKDLLESYIDDVKQKLDSLNKQIISEDIQKIVELAHTVKGASYSIGAVKTGEEAYAIELSAKSGDLLSVKERIERLKMVVSETELALKDYLS